MATGDNMRVRGEVTAYRIWCEAQSVGWECTVMDLAEALDMRPEAIRKALARKGWTGRVSSGRTGWRDTVPVDRLVT